MQLQKIQIKIFAYPVIYVLQQNISNMQPNLQKGVFHTHPIYQLW